MENVLLNRVRELNIPLGSYAIFGSGPLCIRGFKEFRDIDVITKQDLYKKLKNRYPKNIIIKDNRKFIFIDGLEIISGWGPGKWDISALIDDSEIISSLPFVKLKHVLKWKKTRNLQKDREHIKLIKENIGDELD